MPRNHRVTLDATDQPSVEAAVSSQRELLQDAALEQARILERRAMIDQLDVTIEFESDSSGTVSLSFSWTVRNACADQTFADRDRLRIPFRVEDQTLVLNLPPKPVDREPDEI